jgi:hypothetical protein
MAYGCRLPFFRREWEHHILLGGPASSLGVGCYGHELGVSCTSVGVFFAPTRYKVIKIVRSYFEVVLRTTNLTMIYPGSGLCLEVIALRLSV